jgi:hypothetical protein
VQSFLEYVHRSKAEVDYRRRRLDLAIPQAANQILDAVRDPSEAPQAYLSGRSLYRVDGTEQPVNLIWIVVAFKRKQAIANDLKMLLRFGLEEFEDFVGHFIVERQGIKVGARQTCV